MSTETEALWSAVDAITKPTKRKLDRSPEAEWLEGVENEHPWQRRSGAFDVCDIAVYRATVERMHAAMLAYGEIPSLWDQATWALTTGSEQNAGGNSPLRERSPADLNLMETMADIREAVKLQLEGRNVRPEGDAPAQMRRLASTLIRIGNPEHIAWWTFRFEQWARVLATYLQAVDRAPRPVRLRNAPCPLCRTRQVVVVEDGERKVYPPILIDFENGWIRAARCTACGQAWFRGNDLGQLADMLEAGHAEAV